MAYTLLSQSFGAAKANLPVTITEASTGVPAVILSSATGGLVNSNGDTFLDASGNLSCYVDGDKTWAVKVDSGATQGPPVGLLSSSQVASGAVGVPGVKADGSLVGPTGSSIGLSALQLALSPVLSFRAQGTVASPVSTTVCNSTQGQLGTPSNLIIPANTLQIGSKIFCQVKVRRTGNAQTDTLYVRLGKNNGSLDSIMGNGNFTTVANPVDGVFITDIDVTGPTTVLSTQQRYLQNIGTATSFAEVTGSALDIASDMYLTFQYTTATPSVDAFVLLSYDVVVYR